MDLKKEGAQKCARRAADVLLRGGVVLYPTDTLYGLGADALSDEAVAKIYEIKGREEGKPIHCIVADMEMANEYGVLNDLAHQFAKEFLPGPLTIILKKRSQVRTGIGKSIETIGFRVPNDELCAEMVRAFGKPITATSANRADEPTLPNVQEILKQIGENASEIDLVVDAGVLRGSKPSTVVDVSGKEPIILREGAISAAEIWNAIRVEY